MLCDKRCLLYVTRYTRTHQSLGSWRRHAKQHVSFINFKPLELYWIYLLAFQTTTPKVSPRRLTSLDHKLKMQWCTLGFFVILCKCGLLLKKSLAMSVREVIWAVSFDSLLKPDLYVDVDDIMGYDPNWWKGNWTMNPPLEVRIAGHVSPIHVVEWDMSLFWTLKRFTQKIHNMLM